VHAAGQLQAFNPADIDAQRVIDIINPMVDFLTASAPAVTAQIEAEAPVVELKEVNPV